MATYAVGDIQGCYHAFIALLARIQFDLKHDRLWLVGDLINRGNGSLEVLRWCYAHQDVITTVLGNHDLHTLVVANGIAPPHRSDTLEPLLTATDSEQLLDWLRYQPLIHSDHGYTMVHAGLLPQWTITQALALGAEVESALRSNNYHDFLVNMYGNLPSGWHDDLTGFDRLRVITNVLTRLRICTQTGQMEFKFKGELADIPAGYLPWFDVPDRQTKNDSIIFGHWSALGLQQRQNIYALDTGCLWGGKLTAFCLETKAITQVPCNLQDAPLPIER